MEKLAITRFSISSVSKASDWLDLISEIRSSALISWLRL
jgi:hypothetical protein